jgi:hypothetical protein
LAGAIGVDITATLTVDLAALSDALNDSSAGVEDSLRRLGADVKSAVESFLGLSITIRTFAHPVTLTVREASAQSSLVLSSLLIPLPLPAAHDATGELILYAGRHGALVDMAADLSWSVGAGLSKFILDQHRGVDLDAGVSGLKELSAINQAVGVLAGHGFTVADAHTELRERARHSHRELHVVALDIIISSTHRPKPRPA